jgi:hypothetical protein
MSDDEVDGDIVHEEDPEDTNQVKRSGRLPRAVQDSIAKVSKSPERRYTSNSYKRKASDSLPQSDISDLQQPQQKRARLGSEDGPWKPSGGARRNARRPDDRPPTPRSISTAEPHSYASLPPIGSTYSNRGEERENDDAVSVRPEEVPFAIREVFASMPQDVLLDITEVSGRGPRLLARFGVPQKQPDEYSINEPAIRSRERRAALPVMETLLKLRERSDTRALRRVMKMIIANPLTGWDQMSKAEQEELREQKHQELAEERDKCGRSANAFSNQILKLATSCVGEAAMLQFLMQSRTAKLRVMSLFEGLVDMEEDGKLRLLAGDRGFQNHDEEETSSTITYEGEGEDSTEAGAEAAAFACKWQACGKSFDAAAALYVSPPSSHLT